MTTTNYTEQATKLYNFNKENNGELLESILIDLADTNGEPIFDLGEWLDEFDNNAELIKIVQQSDHFDVNDTWIKGGIYYNDFTTGNSAIDLIDEDTAIDWIASALEYDPDTVEDLDVYTED